MGQAGQRPPSSCGGLAPRSWPTSLRGCECSSGKCWKLIMRVRKLHTHAHTLTHTRTADTDCAAANMVYVSARLEQEQV